MRAEEQIDLHPAASSPPPVGVLTLLVTPPPSLLVPDTAGATAEGRLIGSGCSTLGLALPVRVAALDLFRIKLGKKEFLGELGLTSGAVPAPGEPLGDVRGKGEVGRAICVGRCDEPGRAISSTAWSGGEPAIGSKTV